MPIADESQSKCWEEESERGEYRTRFSFEEVRQAARPARHDVTGGAGAWYEYAPQ